ncbi:MAG TPA: FAD-dependent oxidoreductase [Solirubrobacteraceae bacterium]
MTIPQTITEIARTTPVVDESDVLVVGGGPAGVSAAVAAARSGARVTLIERYPHLGGMASGGMVLVLDDMVNGDEVTTTGLVGELIERLEKLGLAVSPPPEDRRVGWDTWRRWARWGCNDFRAHGKPQPIVYAVAFDPDGWKRVSEDVIVESGVNLRLHSWFAEPIVEDGRIRGALVETKSGRQALLAEVVVDATGDLDVASRAGAPCTAGSYMVTTVFRLGDVDTEAALRFEQEHPTEFTEIDRQAKHLLGGAWDMWWLRTPLPGVVWCNCPHLIGYDAVDVEDMTAATLEGRRRITALVAFARAHLPGFERCYLLDVASQLGVRQTRLLRGEYVVTRRDVVERRHFPDTVCRGRDYYTPYRALLPQGVDQLLVAGRHYSAESAAQKISREIPPCMAQGQATGIAAALALSAGIRVRDVDPTAIQRAMRAQGADPGDVAAANAGSPSDIE